MRFLPLPNSCVLHVDIELQHINLSRNIYSYGIHILLFKKPSEFFKKCTNSLAEKKKQFTLE